MNQEWPGASPLAYISHPQAVNTEVLGPPLHRPPRREAPAYWVGHRDLAVVNLGYACGVEHGEEVGDTTGASIRTRGRKDDLLGGPGQSDEEGRRRLDGV